MSSTLSLSRLLVLTAWSALSCLRADSPPFLPMSAPQLEITSIAKHEVRDSTESKGNGPRIKVARG
ncbi:MAG TPA: hypothetical protein VGE39_03235, partial [Prosthecobacter sp.]